MAILGGLQGQQGSRLGSQIWETVSPQAQPPAYWEGTSMALLSRVSWERKVLLHWHRPPPLRPAHFMLPITIRARPLLAGPPTSSTRGQMKKWNYELLRGAKRNHQERQRGPGDRHPGGPTLKQKAAHSPEAQDVVLLLRKWLCGSRSSGERHVWGGLAPGNPRTVSLTLESRSP